MTCAATTIIVTGYFPFTNPLKFPLGLIFASSDVIAWQVLRKSNASSQYKEQPTSRYLRRPPHTSIGRSGPNWHFQMFCRKSFLCAHNLNPLSISRLPSRRNIALGKSVNQIFGIAFSVNIDFVKFLFYDVVI